MLIVEGSVLGPKVFDDMFKGPAGITILRRGRVPRVKSGKTMYRVLKLLLRTHRSRYEMIRDLDSRNRVLNTKCVKYYFISGYRVRLNVGKLDLGL